jgi:hypothetical protein
MHALHAWISLWHQRPIHALTAWDLKFQVCVGHTFTPTTLPIVVFPPQTYFEYRSVVSTGEQTVNTCCYWQMRFWKDKKSSIKIESLIKIARLTVPLHTSLFVVELPKEPRQVQLVHICGVFAGGQYGKPQISMGKLHQRKWGLRSIYTSFLTVWFYDAFS